MVAKDAHDGFVRGNVLVDLKCTSVTTRAPKMPQTGQLERIGF